MICTNSFFVNRLLQGLAMFCLQSWSSQARQAGLVRSPSKQNATIERQELWRAVPPQIGVLYCLVWRDFPTFLWYSLLLIQPSEDSLNRAPLDQSYSGADEQRQLGCMRWNSDFSAFKARWYLFRHPVRSKKHGLTEQASYTSQHQAQIILYTRHGDILLLASVPSHIVTHFLMEVLTSPPTAWPFFRHLRDELL